MALSVKSWRTTRQRPAPRTLRYSAEIDARPFQVDTVFESGRDTEVVRTVLVALLGGESDRHPQLRLGSRELKAGRHDADDGVAAGVECQ